MLISLFIWNIIECSNNETKDSIGLYNISDETKSQ